MDEGNSEQLTSNSPPGTVYAGGDMEMSQLEIAIDTIQRESAENHSSRDDPIVSTIHPPRPHAHRSVSFGPTSYSESYSANRSISFSSYPSIAHSTTLDEDEIALVEDVDIEMSLPSGLVSMDFPKADDGHEEDIAKVIRKSFSKLGLRPGAQDAMSALSKSGLSLGHITRMSQVEAAVEGQKPGDQFWEEVATKTQRLGIGKLEAIFEVYTDLLLAQAGTPDQALLWVLRQDFKEFCMEVFVIRLLERGASVFTAGYDRNTPLHLAALKGFASIGRKIIEEGALIHAQNNHGQTSLEIAVHNEHSDFSVMIIKSMEPGRVRQMFQGYGNTPSKLSLHKLLDTPSMKEAVLLCLNTMMEAIPGQKDTYLIHYAILDGDVKGRAPSDTKFEKSNKSCLHKIAKSNNKDVVYHDVVRLLLRRKWKKFARSVFFLQFVYFLLVMTTLTCALVLAAKKTDPRLYDAPVDVFRGICEAVILVSIGYNGFSEINQLRIHRLLYFKDYYNYLDVPSVMFLFLIIPFRAANLNVQWLFASLCYLFNGLRAFKYAAVFRSTGAYVQILFQILLRDMIQFGAIFAVFLVSFSGAFYLALRGEERAVSDASCNNVTGCDMNATNDTDSLFETMIVNTSLNIYPFETEELYNVWLTGLRVMIEGGSIVDQYFGPNGFMWFGVIIYLTYLFLVIVVLLNLLIAQMSDTYGSVQQDAQRSLAINRAWIVARVEHNSFLARDHRKRFYKSCEVIKNPRDVLERWEVPPINEVNRKLERLERTIRKQEESIDELRNTVIEKLSDQNRILEQLVSRTYGTEQGDQTESDPYHQHHSVL